MPDDRWKTTYEIKQKETHIEDGDLGSRFELVYEVVNVHNSAVIGTYRTYSYAVKQARRKYKKLVKLMEKTFMSVT